MSKKQAAGGITAIFGGAYYLLTGFLDPSFLLSIDIWYPFAKVFTRAIGPMIAPSVSWQSIGGLLGVMFLVASLAKLNKRRKNDK